VKYDLDQHVAQFLPHMREVPAINRLDQLTHLVDEATHERRMGLLLIPRTSAGLRPQSHHRLFQIVNRTHQITVPAELTEYTENFAKKFRFVFRVFRVFRKL
jgi:hypothetical protein